MITAHVPARVRRRLGTRYVMRVTATVRKRTYWEAAGETWGEATLAGYNYAMGHAGAHVDVIDTITNVIERSYDSLIA